MPANDSTRCIVAVEPTISHSLSEWQLFIFEGSQRTAASDFGHRRLRARSCRWGRAAFGKQSFYVSFPAANSDRRLALPCPEPPDAVFMVHIGFRHKAEVERNGKLPLNVAIERPKPAAKLAGDGPSRMAC